MSADHVTAPPAIDSPFPTMDAYGKSPSISSSVLPVVEEIGSGCGQPRARDLVRRNRLVRNKQPGQAE